MDLSIIDGSIDRSSEHASRAAAMRRRAETSRTNGRGQAQRGKVRKIEGGGLVIKEIGRQRTDPKRIRRLSISLPLHCIH